MNLPPPLEEKILALLSERTGRKVFAISCHHVSGGSINEAAAVSTGTDRIFVKWNDANRYPGMFQAEARGLMLLKDPGGALVPEVLEVGETGRYAYLALSHIERGYHDEQAAKRFGEMLAALHHNTATSFGLDHNNYMGSLPQRNATHTTWNDFFIHERLLPQLNIARQAGSLSSTDAQAFDRLFQQLPSIIPEEPPTLVHGDLWSGNFIAGTDDRTWLIDPAVAYGHREVDIAMSRLFGGFSASFYQAYLHHFPLAPGWEQRIGIFQLYPLLIHVNLFGGGYIGSVRSILRYF